MQATHSKLPPGVLTCGKRVLLTWVGLSSPRSHGYFIRENSHSSASESHPHHRRMLHTSLQLSKTSAGLPTLHHHLEAPLELHDPKAAQKQSPPYFHLKCPHPPLLVLNLSGIETSLGHGVPRRVPELWLCCLCIK